MAVGILETIGQSTQEGNYRTVEQEQTSEILGVDGKIHALHLGLIVQSDFASH